LPDPPPPPARAPPPDGAARAGAEARAPPDDPLPAEAVARAPPNARDDPAAGDAVRAGAEGARERADPAAPDAAPPRATALASFVRGTANAGTAPRGVAVARPGADAAPAAPAAPAAAMRAAFAALGVDDAPPVTYDREARLAVMLRTPRGVVTL